MADPLAGAIDRCLPAAIPRRERLLDLAARHARLVLAANERLNLTRITAPEDVAVKHVLDSVLPWSRLIELAPGGSTPAIADLGSGAGWPGILLAALLPGARVVLIESIGKKAAFLAETVRALALENVEVCAGRGEARLSSTPADLVVARAVGPARDLLRTLRPARAGLRRLLLWKGPGVELEMAQAARDASRLGLSGAITFRGELPEGAGARFLLEYSAPEPAREE